MFSEPITISLIQKDLPVRVPITVTENVSLDVPSRLSTTNYIPRHLTNQKIVYNACDASWINVWNTIILPVIEKQFLDCCDKNDWWIKPNYNPGPSNNFYFFRPINISNKKSDHSYYAMCSMILTVLQIRQYFVTGLYYARNGNEGI